MTPPPDNRWDALRDLFPEEKKGDDAPKPETPREAIEELFPSSGPSSPPPSPSTPPITDAFERIAPPPSEPSRPTVEVLPAEPSGLRATRPLRRPPSDVIDVSPNLRQDFEGRRRLIGGILAGSAALATLGGLTAAVQYCGSGPDPSTPEGREQIVMAGRARRAREAAEREAAERAAKEGREKAVAAGEGGAEGAADGKPWLERQYDRVKEWWNPSRYTEYNPPAFALSAAAKAAAVKEAEADSSLANPELDPWTKNKLTKAAMVASIKERLVETMLNERVILKEGVMKRFLAAYDILAAEGITLIVNDSFRTNEENYQRRFQATDGIHSKVFSGPHLRAQAVDLQNTSEKHPIGTEEQRDRIVQVMRECGFQWGIKSTLKGKPTGKKLEIGWRWGLRGAGKAGRWLWNWERWGKSTESESDVVDDITLDDRVHFEMTAAQYEDSQADFEEMMEEKGIKIAKG